jgi:hypothetical protein
MGQRIDRRPINSAGGLQVGSGGTKYSQMKTYTPTLSPVAVAANITAEQTFTLAGLKVGD